MSRVRPATVSDAREFFSDELKTVLEKHHVSAHHHSVEYLVSLLLRFMESRNFFAKGDNGKLENNFLVKLYAQYIRGNHEEKKLALQRLGDICMLVSGFFAESLQRKVVDVGYYFGMGGVAYQQLSQLQMSAVAKELYAELSDKFKPFSNVLGEMSERAGIQSNRDLLRLYERWLATGSDRLKTLLSEQGIQTPVHVDLKSRH